MRKTLIVCAVLMAGSAAGAETVSGWDRFQLWNRCHPVRLSVSVGDAETSTEVQKKIGLTVKEIETAALSTLRRTRLYDPNAFNGKVEVLVDATGSALSVGRVFARGAAFLIQVNFLKAMYDPLSKKGDEIYSLETWRTGGFGLYDKDSETWLLSNISGYMDEFVEKYLRVNGPACKS
ncbi:MAG: hypothetical protein OXF79_10525 [Chloroflexi bacterium]|nr:hypothetical protein [Chloroflexota bacterium]